MSIMVGEAAERVRPNRVGFLPEVDYWHVWTPMGMHGVLSCICDATPHLENGSAQVPMKVVTSCDKLRGGARIPLIRRSPNGTS